ncbi:MAG TPA: hypothetical protein PLD76_04785 [Paludibacteraceae bacterium]|nr:hypothetical protein [Paludibacteraceae bacterium]
MEYRRPGVNRYFVEKELLPAYDSHTTNSPNTVLMGTGRKRRTREIQGWATRADYAAMVDDKNKAIKRTVTFDDGFTMDARIDKLEGNEQLGYNIVWYEAVFIEG